MVNLVDVGHGNILSLKNWINFCGHNVKIIKNPSEFDGSTIILPGMCNSYSLMMALKNKKLDIEIIKRVNKGQKIVGICAGMQIMGKYIVEDKGCDGLGLVKYTTKELNSESSYSLINNGWIDIKSDNIFQNTRGMKFIFGRYYFNHQYCMYENEENNCDLLVKHSIFSREIISFFISKNIIGMQFHPEKSQSSGYSIGKLFL